MSWFITVAFNKQLENPQKEVIYKFILHRVKMNWGRHTQNKISGDRNVKTS